MLLQLLVGVEAAAGSSVSRPVFETARQLQLRLRCNGILLVRQREPLLLPMSPKALRRDYAQPHICYSSLICWPFEALSTDIDFCCYGLGDKRFCLPQSYSNVVSPAAACRWQGYLVVENVPSVKRTQESVSC